MSNPDLHVVLGASGGAGNAIVKALHEAGHSVRAVNRSGTADLPDRIDRLAADIANAEGAARAVEGAAVVYMAAQPAYHRWPEEFPPMLETVIDATAEVGAKLVMVDNLYGHGPGAGTMTEDTVERATDSKGEVRRGMTQMLLDADRSEKLMVTIGRASDYFGPSAVNSAITALAIEPASSGRRIRWAGSLDVPHSCAYLPDVARAYVAIGTSDKADGEIWILPHARPVTGRQFLELVNDALPQPMKTGVLSRTMLRMAAPFHKVSKEMLEILHQWTEPFVVDDSKFRRVFGTVEVTPLEKAIAETVSWYRSHGSSLAS